MITRRALIRSAVGLSVAVVLSPLAALAQGRSRSGALRGENGHEASGTVEISPAMVTLQGDFRYDGPDGATVALGRDGYDPSTILGALVANRGRQSFRIPARIDPARYNEVWIWSDASAGPLAVARVD